MGNWNARSVRCDLIRMEKCAEISLHLRSDAEGRRSGLRSKIWMEKYAKGRRSGSLEVEGLLCWKWGKNGAGSVDVKNILENREMREKWEIEILWKRPWNEMMWRTEMGTVKNILLKVEIGWGWFPWPWVRRSWLKGDRLTCPLF